GELETAVILTTAPNELLARVHDRMPVVIPAGIEEAWLGPAVGPELRALEPLLAPWDPVGWEAVRLEPGSLRPLAAPHGATPEGQDPLELGRDLFSPPP
ncbi:MAG: SOS response-associated peptidase family protein, partial [Cyanobium sp.]